MAKESIYEYIEFIIKCKKNSIDSGWESTISIIDSLICILNAECKFKNFNGAVNNYKDIDRNVHWRELGWARGARASPQNFRG